LTRRATSGPFNVSTVTLAGRATMRATAEPQLDSLARHVVGRLTEENEPVILYVMS